MEVGWNVKRRDYYPNSVGKKVPIPGGLKLYSINVTFYKNELDHKLQKENPDSGSITLHAATGKNFAKQMCAEYQNERGYRICDKGKDNHHWDIAVHGLDCMVDTGKNLRVCQPQNLTVNVNFKV